MTQLRFGRRHVGPLRHERRSGLGGADAAAQDGDEHAYASLLRALLPTLRGVARRRIGNRAEAEDAVQDALLSIHRLRHSWTGPARCGPGWSRSASGAVSTACAPSPPLVTRNLDRLTSVRAARIRPGGEARGRRPAVAAGHRGPAGQPATGPAPAKLEGLSLAEASLRSGMTIGALKVATHRALHALRRRLDPGAEPA
jgi:RNA polymerase sigma-70 factor (ECF subfamily)